MAAKLEPAPRLCLQPLCRWATIGQVARLDRDREMLHKYPLIKLLRENPPREVAVIPSPFELLLLFGRRQLCRAVHTMLEQKVRITDR